MSNFISSEANTRCKTGLPQLKALRIWLHIQKKNGDNQMFTITKNAVYTVNRATSGIKKDGTGYALVKLVENQNQPEGIENPSRSNYAVNSWFAAFPEELAGIKDGCLVRLVDFDGFKIIHDSYEAYGKRCYRDITELVNPKFELA